MSLENRKNIDIKVLRPILNRLAGKIEQKVKQRGGHTFASRHEILGQITEEFIELSEAVRTDKSEFRQHIRDELFDIAIASIWGIASIDTNSVDW